MHPYTQGHAMPGMEFFQSLLKGSGLPTGFASWMAPTMDPKELEQKITDLKAVLQWLEANAKLTQATIQTLEVQRMTLSALKTMNVDLGALAGRMTDAMQAGAQAMETAAAAAEDRAGAAPQGPEHTPAAPSVEETPHASAEETGAASPLPGVMDPMQWWNAVSEQFSQVATQALRESPWPMPMGASAGASGASEAGAAGSTPAERPARRAKKAHSGGSQAAKPAVKAAKAVVKPAAESGRRGRPAARTRTASK